MSNILEWYYVIFGPKGSVYEGGVYLGKIKFPPEYPHKPPSLLMITPSGRFQTNSRLCLSMSDFHPESWNPMWTVSSILTGLLSFMLENKETHGSIMTTDTQKRKVAAFSKKWNSQNPIFRKHFPDLVDQNTNTEPLSSTREPLPDTPVISPSPTPTITQTTTENHQVKDIRFNLFMVVVVLIMFISFINLWL